MQAQPKCSLCSGQLVLEKGVKLTVANPAWIMAWVCTNCSTAYPVATSKGGVVRPPKPLYENGTRTD